MLQRLAAIARSQPVGITQRLRWANPAWLCVASALALSLLGIYAIDLGRSDPTGSIYQPSSLAIKQAVLLFIGLLAAGTVALPPYRILCIISWAIYAACIGLLVFLLIPIIPDWIVTPRNGTRGWINLGVTDLQPAELAKVAFVMACAQHLRYRKSHRKLLGLITPGLIAFVPIMLIILQPDLGTASLFAPSLLAMLIAAGARLKHLALILTIALMAAPASYPLLRPHQRTRIVALVKQFQGDTESASDINYQSYTAQKLIGAGGMTGMNEPHARAIIRFNPLPERHNDMIFAVISTRFGLLGGLVVILLYTLWMLGALLTAATTRCPLGRLLAVGLSLFIATQAVINIGMNIGLLPIVGITLPFVSAGGSSMIASWIMVGLLVNVALRPPVPPFRSAFEFDEPADD